MMPIGDNQLLVLHLCLNEPDSFVVSDHPHRVFNAVLIFQANVRSPPGDLLQSVIDSLLRILVEHEDLFKLSSRMTQQLESIFFGTRQRSLMRKYDFVCVILQFTQRDKSLSNPKFIFIRHIESLEVDKQRRLRKLLQDSAGSPLL